MNEYSGFVITPVYSAGSEIEHYKILDPREGMCPWTTGNTVSECNCIIDSILTVNEMVSNQ
jgi:hypothetical protein